MPKRISRNLDSLVYDRIKEANDAGEPIRVMMGPGYAVALKATLGFKADPSALCRALNRLKDMGRVHEEISEEKQLVFVGNGTPRSYPTATLTPA